MKKMTQMVVAALAAVAMMSGNLFAETDSYTQLPKMLKAEQTYPSTLQRTGVEGFVKVEAVLDEKGEVISAEVIESSHPGFNQSALRTITNAKFAPALNEDGQPVAVRVAIPVTYRLTQPENVRLAAR